MAKQNFLAGGFYGKLGQTVGQRWRNKRTIRTYVKTPNPDTPAQQENRNRFAQAIESAQRAMVFNKGAPCWNIEDKTEFQYRTSTAKRRIDAGMTGFAVLPLFPDSYSPAVTLTNVQKETVSQNVYRFASVGYTHEADGREMIVALMLKNTTTRLYEEVRFGVVILTGGDYLFQLALPTGYEFGNDSVIYGISIDDENNSGNMVYMPSQPCGTAETIVIDDLVAQSYEGEYVRFTSAKLTALGRRVEMTLHIQATDGLQIQRREFDTTAYFDPQSNNSLYMYLKDPYCFVGDDAILSGTVTTFVQGYVLTIAECGSGSTLGERFWVGEAEAGTEVEYMSAYENEQPASLTVLSQRGQGMMNQFKVNFTYPYHPTPSTTESRNVDNYGNADILGENGLEMYFTLDPDEQHPEQAGDKMQIAYAGVGGPIFFYGVSNYTIDMR